MQNTFRAIGHRTAHRPLCHEYLTPDRTTFSGLSPFYTVLWHITLKAICKKQYSSRASNTPPPGQPQVIPHILQNTFRAIGHRTVHRPLCHEYPTPDRTTFSGLSSFYTVLWHITLKAICKITELLTCLKHATSRPSLSIPFQNHLVRLIPTLTGQNSYRCRFCPAIQVFPRANSYCCRFCPAIQVLPQTNLGQSPNQIAARRTARSDLNIQTRWEPPISSS